MTENNSPCDRGHGRSTTVRARAVTAVVGSTLMLVLAGCSGGGSKVAGTYYNDEGQLSIKNSAVEYRDFGCDSNHFPAVDQKPTASGELSKDRSQIVWASDDEKLVNAIVKGTDTITMSESGDLVTIKKYTFKKMSEKDALAGYKKCQNSVKA